MYISILQVLGEILNETQVAFFSWCFLLLLRPLIHSVEACLLRALNSNYHFSPLSSVKHLASGRVRPKGKCNYTSQSRS